MRSTNELFRTRQDSSVPLLINGEIPRVIELWRGVLLRNRCSLQLDLLAEEGDSVWMPQHGFHELLSALLVNAVEAHARRIILRTMSSDHAEIEGTTIGKALHLSVRDDGAGIPPGDVKKLFVPSFSTKLDRQGLGLFIARSLARQAGGELHYEGAPQGRGSTFTAVLPVRVRP